MFILDGKQLKENTQFEHNGVQYPANWLNLTTLAEKEAIGITEVPDTPKGDDRFYWDGNTSNPKALEDVLATKEDGSPLYVQEWNEETETMVDTEEQVVTKGLKSNFISSVKLTARNYLAKTDWMIVRKHERSIDVPEEVTTERSAIIAEESRLETAITGATTVEELIQVLNTQNWPKDDK